MNRAERRRARRASGELSRGEVWVPPLRECPEEWERDNALFVNRLMRRAGPFGRVVGWLFLIGVALTFIPLLAMGIRPLFAR